jgi:hypothetical protein
MKGGFFEFYLFAKDVLFLDHFIKNRFFMNDSYIIVYSSGEAV